MGMGIGCSPGQGTCQSNHERPEHHINRLDFREVSVMPRKAFIDNGHLQEDSPGRPFHCGGLCQTGYHLRAPGFHFGRMKGEPAWVLPRCDVFFARGHPAVDTMACGCAVVRPGKFVRGTRPADASSAGWSGCRWGGGFDGHRTG